MAGGKSPLAFASAAEKDVESNDVLDTRRVGCHMGEMGETVNLNCISFFFFFSPFFGFRFISFSPLLFSAFNSAATFHMPRISPWSISRRRNRSHEDNLQDREIRNAWHPGPPQRNRGIARIQTRYYFVCTVALP